MARKRKRTNTTRRRRRVSGTGKADVMDVISLAAGTVAGRFLATKFGAAMDSKIVAAVQVVGGILVAAKGKGIVANIGKGIAVAGVLGAAQDFNLISGIGAAPLVTFSDRSLGFPNQPVIQGFDNPNAVMNGMSELSVISGGVDMYY